MFIDFGGTAKSRNKKPLCGSANDLIMRFMDGNINPAEEKRLMAHISECGSCGEDFAVYAKITAEFSAAETIIAAPDKFEENVMLKVQTLCKTLNRKTSLDRLVLVAIGALSAICGALALLLIDKDAIANFFMESETFGAFAESVAAFTNDIGAFFSNAGAAVSTLVSENKMLLISIFGGLVVAQFAFKTRAKPAFADEREEETVVTAETFKAPVNEKTAKREAIEKETVKKAAL